MAMPETVVQRWNEMTKEEQTVDFIDYLLLKRERERRPQKTHFQFQSDEGDAETAGNNNGSSKSMQRHGR